MTPAQQPPGRGHIIRPFRVRLVLGSITVVAMVVAVLTPVGQASAVEYPTWAEVEAARASETEGQALVAQITTQIAELDSAATASAELALTRGAEYEEADAQFLDAAYQADTLQEQARTAEATATQSRDRAAQIIASQARSGGQDLTSTLLTGAQDPDDFLSQLGFSDKLAETSQGIYVDASQDQNIAQGLGDQAALARDARDALRQEADDARRDAEAASAAADEALAVQVDKQAELQAQLAVLTDQRAATEQDFAAGEAARAAERARIQAEAAARAAAAAAAATSAGQVAGSGWANPTTGRMVSAYGYRIHPIQRIWKLHSGIDIAGGCGVPIYAASAGTVAYSGVYGSYGNWILLEHANGIQTGYAHIENGGLLVSRGQRVEAGQLIARAGSTGGSTGCHLHYEVRPGGTSTDPAPFMSARGIRLG